MRLERVDGILAVSLGLLTPPPQPPLFALKARKPALVSPTLFGFVRVGSDERHENEMGP